MKLALAILSFRRYEYLRLSLETLTRNVRLNEADYWLFQDNVTSQATGREYASQAERDSCLKVFNESRLPNKFVYRQTWNVGPAMQTYEAFDILFARKYDFVMLVPCDLVYGKFYVQSVLTLAEQYKKEAGLLHTLPVAAKGVTLGELKAYRCELSNRVAWGSPEADGGRIDQGMWRDAWKVIKDDVLQFRRMIAGHDFMDLAVPVTAEAEATKAAVETEFGTVQADLAIPMIAEKHGLKALHTVAPRASHFGGDGCYKPVRHRRLDLKRLEWCSKDFWLWDIGNTNRYYLLNE